MKGIQLSAILMLLYAAALPAAKTLDMWVVDVEGGKALLLVSPSGRSMLVDTGWPGNDDRDTTRILEACKDAGVTKLDVLVTTHYDSDHVGNAPAFLSKMPATIFVDHGPPAEGNRMPAAYKPYQEIAEKGKHIVVKPGDKIPFEGVDVLVVTSNGDVLKSSLKGAGAANPSCAGVERRVGREGSIVDTSENAKSVGLLFTFGQFRMLDLADLTWNVELDLMCPANPIGTVDLFMVSHHGNDISNSLALVNPLQAKVQIMDNGMKKIGAAAAMKVLKAAPGLQALYLLHWSASAPDDNPPNEYIANLEDSPDGKWIKVSAEQGGPFTVTNARTGVSKTFKK